MRIPLLLSTALVLFGCATSKSASKEAKDQSMFARWLLPVEGGTEVRGGTTTGTPVEVDMSESAAWKAIQAAKTKKEKDRQAILAMAGPYRASFEFLETIGFDPQYKLDQPYRSWGTEFVYVVAEEENFISLQHLMVMFFQKDGKVSGPMVMKHWRQDWAYEKSSFHTFQGLSTWARTKSQSPKGKWMQSVYQVDDSPRYAGIGEWQHLPNMSIWTSGETWRPLPRREFSVRSDYQALIGTNRHTIVPYGWTHEEDNLKGVVSQVGVKPQKYLAREIGLNRYQRIKNFDFAPGDAYWKATSPFWKDVRDFWDGVFKKNATFTFVDDLDGKKMFEPLFTYAQEIADGKTKYDPKESKAFVSKTLTPYLGKKADKTKY